MEKTIEKKKLYCLDLNPKIELESITKNGNKSKALSQERYAFKLFSEVLQLYKPNEIMLSFNGGKDCTVLLHLLTAFMKHNPLFKNYRLPVLYIQAEDAFDEIERFVKRCEESYPIDLMRRKGNIKSALADMCLEFPHIKAVFMGCRKSDPHCEGMKIMKATDPGWPALMRINPILEWTCLDVWNYLLANNVPYCRLYDLGYTSLGTKSNTHRNPHLKIFDQRTGKVGYKPAYEMPDDDTLERAGRS